MTFSFLFKKDNNNISVNIIKVKKNKLKINTMSQHFINYLRFCTGESIDKILNQKSYQSTIENSKEELSESSNEDDIRETHSRNIS